MSMSIQGAHIFSAGEWNRQSFTEADLDSIVSAFNESGKAGRVPLKYGHSDDEGGQPFREGLPSLGWVSKLWRQGKKLMADFSDMPTAVFESVRKGLYRFTSIELLKNAKYDGKTYPYLLDAVALLGAEPPAVDGLDDLQKLTLARSSFKYSGRLCFTTANEADDDIADLREQLRVVTEERDTAREELLQFKRGDLKAIKDAEAKRVVDMCLRFIKEAYEKPLPPKKH